MSTAWRSIGADGRGDGGADRAGATTHVEDDGSWPGDGDRVSDEELRASSGDEDTRIHHDPHAAELRPSDDVFDGLAGGSSLDHGREVGRRAGGGDEQPRFVLGEDTAGGTQPGLDPTGGRSDGRFHALILSDRR